MYPFETFAFFCSCIRGRWQCCRARGVPIDQRMIRLSGGTVTTNTQPGGKSLNVGQMSGGRRRRADRAAGLVGNGARLRVGRVGQSRGQCRAVRESQGHRRGVRRESVLVWGGYLTMTIKVRNFDTSMENVLTDKITESR